ncbi:NAD(P)-dependent oxidoreductase [Halegenticoccus soli]|uniref:NAD(P)-dependent oxidoreductase n=1 Tax=Halegenticoccus soli TaxID=1985678 RepID=UPI001E3169B8|nr:NAD(P)-dependent oxidoreductase [Halegenticoccus soli]
MTSLPRALVDQDIQPAERLRERSTNRFDLTFGVDSTEEALIESLEGQSVLFTTSRLPVSERVLRRASSLELVAKVGTGLDSVDLSAAADFGVGVIYTPGFNALSVAEHALALLLTVNRNVVAGRDTLRAGGWRDTMPTSRPVTGTTVGIVGFGDVGRRFAGLLTGFNVTSSRTIRTSTRSIPTSLAQRSSSSTNSSCLPTPSSSPRSSPTRRAA